MTRKVLFSYLKKRKQRTFPRVSISSLLKVRWVKSWPPWTFRIIVLLLSFLLQFRIGVPVVSFNVLTGPVLVKKLYVMV